MDVKEFKSRVAEGRLGGTFIFSGDEDYLKKHYLSQLRGAIVTDPAFAPFNYASFDGESLDFGELVEAISSPPFMSDYKLVEWKYPAFDKMKEGELKKFEDLLTMVEERPYITLAFITNDSDILPNGKKESKFVKRFSDRINLLTFRKFTESNSQGLYHWLREHFSAEGIKVDLGVVQELVFRAGHSMSVLSGEVEKISAYLKASGRDTASKDDVTLVASSTPESDTFALSNAVLNRNKKDAFSALNEMKWRRVDPIIIFSMLARVCSELASVSELLLEGQDAKDIEKAMKMHPFTLKLYIAAAKKYTPDRVASMLSELSRADADSKFGGVAGYTAIELFLAKCL